MRSMRFSALRMSRAGSKSRLLPHLLHCSLCRAEHSMGVAHLAYTLANQIYQLQGKDLDITRSDVKCAEVAGLLPDSVQYSQITTISFQQHATS